MKFSDKNVIILDKFNFKKDSVKECLKMLLIWVLMMRNLY